jgi:hypothetical protein
MWEPARSKEVEPCEDRVGRKIISGFKVFLVEREYDVAQFEVLETRGAPLKSTSVMVMGGGLNKNGDSQMDVAPTIPWILISVVEA